MNKDYVADLECMESAEAVAEKPKNIPEPKTIRTGRDEDKVSLRTAIMEVGQDWREGKRKDNDPLVLSRELWLMSIFQVEEATGKTEVSTPKVAVEGPDYTKEMLKNLMDAALWDAAQVATYINDKYGVKITSASKMFESLSNEQKKATLEHMDKNPKLP